MQSAVPNVATSRAAGSERRTRFVLIGLGLLLGLAVLSLLNLALPHATLKSDMTALPAGVDRGFLDPLGLGYGFYDSETAPGGLTYRWTGPHATLTLPYASNLGRYAHISLRLAANRAPGQPPAEVTLGINGRPQSHFTLASDFEVHDIAFDARNTPNPYLDPAHVQVDIQSSTVTNKDDPRQLGVAVDWIQVQAERSTGEILLESMVWAAAIVALLLITTARLSLLWSLVYGAGALLSFALLHATALPRAIPVTVEVALAGLAWLIAAWLAPTEMPAWGLGLAACGLWLVVAGRILGDWQMDDAYISYRYAWNLVHGSGLVYNPGEVVEGYTNFLWTLLAAAAIAAGLQPAGLMLATNIALALGILGITYHLSSRLSGPAHIWPLLASLFLSVDVALLTYGARGSGMEAAAFAFFVILAVGLLWSTDEGRWTGPVADDGQRTMDDGGKDTGSQTPIVHRLSSIVRPSAGIALALASLTRPEGLLVAVILLVVKAWQDRRASGTREAGTRALAVIVPFLAIVVPYQVWRIAFYGWPFPNTFYAKTGATTALIQRGLEHISFFWGDHWLVATLALLGIAFSLTKTYRGGVLLALAALTTGYVLYIVWVGGDYFPGWRFFVPLVAPIVLLAQEGARAALSFLPRAARTRALRLGAAAVLAVLAMLYLRDAIWLEDSNGWLAQQTRLHTGYISRWGSAGLWLRDNTPPETWTVAKGAGAIAYYSQRRVIDIFGLNDLHIGHLTVADIGEGKAGHEKEDPQYVLNRHPDYILAEWDTNFKPVKAQLKQEYDYLSTRAPTGPTVDWWHLKK